MSHKSPNSHKKQVVEEYVQWHRDNHYKVTQQIYIDAETNYDDFLSKEGRPPKNGIELIQHKSAKQHNLSKTFGYHAGSRRYRNKSNGVTKRNKGRKSTRRSKK